MTFAKTERAALCDLFDEAGPEAPTLCEGWTTHDLAVHLWIRETDPLGAPGMLAKPLAGLTERRMAETKQRWSYGELVDRLRRGPARFSVFAIPGLDDAANTTEFFVHHEDVRRGGPVPQPHRELDAEVEDWMWRRLKLLGRAFFRRAQLGVTLERSDAVTDRGEPDSIRVSTGSSIVTVVGVPSELMLFANGRTTASEVKLVGEPDAIDLLNSTDLNL
jgi:uncharacterized protein (TIGR03085 family)